MARRKFWEISCGAGTYDPAEIARYVKIIGAVGGKAEVPILLDKMGTLYSFGGPNLPPDLKGKQSDAINAIEQALETATGSKPALEQTPHILKFWAAWWNENASKIVRKD